MKINYSELTQFLNKELPKKETSLISKKLHTDKNLKEMFLIILLVKGSLFLKMNKPIPKEINRLIKLYNLKKLQSKPKRETHIMKEYLK